MTIHTRNNETFCLFVCFWNCGSYLNYTAKVPDWWIICFHSNRLKIRLPFSVCNVYMCLPNKFQVNATYRFWVNGNALRKYLSQNLEAENYCNFTIVSSKTVGISQNIGMLSRENIYRSCAQFPTIHSSRGYILIFAFECQRNNGNCKGLRWEMLRIPEIVHFWDWKKKNQQQQR